MFKFKNNRFDRFSKFRRNGPMAEAITKRRFGAKDDRRKVAQNTVSN